MNLVIEQLKDDIKNLREMPTDVGESVIKQRVRFIEQAKRAVTVLTMHMSEDKENENS